MFGLVVANGSSESSLAAITARVPFIFPTASAATGGQQPDFSSNFSRANCGPSQADPDRVDAYSCHSLAYGTEHSFDPCFYAAAGSLGVGLYCVSSPYPIKLYDKFNNQTINLWSMRFLYPQASQTLTLTNRAGARNSPWTRPWGIKLADGTRCLRGLLLNVPGAPPGATYECFNTPTSIPLKRTPKTFIGWIVDVRPSSIQRWTAQLLTPTSEGNQRTEQIVEVRR
jgi:hypothetical protein